MTDADLNAAVAERVMGWKTNEVYGHYYDDSKIDFFERMKGNPDFLATDWSGVRLVVERMKALGWTANIGYGAQCDGWCEFWFGDKTTKSAHANSLPHAVCLAALKAVGGGE